MPTIQNPDFANSVLKLLLLLNISKSNQRILLSMEFQSFSPNFSLRNASNSLVIYRIASYRITSLYLYYERKKNCLCLPFFCCCLFFKRIRNKIHLNQMNEPKKKKKKKTPKYVQTFTKQRNIQKYYASLKLVYDTKVVLKCLSVSREKKKKYVEWFVSTKRL